MTRSTQLKKIKTSKIGYLFIVLIIPLLATLAYNASFVSKIFPNIFIAGINVGGMKPEEATFLISEQIRPPEVIKLTSPTTSYDLKTKDIDLNYDYVASVQRAYNFVRTGNIVYDFYHRVLLTNSIKEFGLITKIDEEKLQSFISVIDGEVSVDPIYPFASLVGGELVINQGKAGTVLDSQLLRSQIGQDIAFAKSDEIQIPINQIDPSLNSENLNKFKERSEKYLSKKLTAKFEYDTFELTDKLTLTFLNPSGGFNDDKIKDEIFKIANKVNREPQEPKFNFENGKVSEFQPALDGVEIDSDKLLGVIKEKLIAIENSKEKITSFELPVTKTAPQVTTDKINNLGINELIGRGTSTYFHSIPGRVHNVSLATSRINGTLVKPGETFSFNQALGDVSKFTGYQTAYVIENGKTVLGDGGGVCQVSTTLFRAILNAGLPVDERRAHAYRVGYYEQGSPPGIDATVYSPTTDFKFTNNTPSHILITAKTDPKNYSLVFELYGTSDGRVASTTKPVVSGVTPPLPDLYQDDPTLPVGVVKQVDFKAFGAKVSFNYSVKRAGEEIYKKTFISNYRPWQAIYLRGTGPAN
ncbi:MAG: VanW family protein [Microgenomates group bacterium]